MTTSEAASARRNRVMAGAELDLSHSSVLDSAAVLDRLGSSPAGLSAAVAAVRLGRYGPNAVRDHRARVWGAGEPAEEPAAGIAGRHRGRLLLPR